MLTGPVGVRAAVFGEEVGDGVTERKQAVEVVRRGSSGRRRGGGAMASSSGGSSTRERQGWVSRPVFQ